MNFVRIDRSDSSEPSALRLMDELARRLRCRRFARGGFDLEIPEAEVRLDASGVPISITRHRTHATNRLIEEFMILANQSVGRFVTDRGLPLIFRVHEEPAVESLRKFAEIALTLVPSASPRDVETLPALRKFLAGLPSGAMTQIVHSFFLRSLKQAIYSPIDVGHFGLGIDAYCHFTSPIRRYPDLFNHRVVRWLVRNPDAVAGEWGSEVRRWQDGAPERSSHCSETERAATAAEREIVRIKVLRWAEMHLGECHWGRVVGLTGSGLFVELEEFPVEGFIPRATLRAGSRLQEERLAFVEGRSKWELRLGDRVEVQIARVDLRERMLDLHLVARREAGRKKGSQGGAKGERGGRKKTVRHARKRQARIKPARSRAERKRGEGRPKKARTPRHRSGGSR